MGSNTPANQPCQRDVKVGMVKRAHDRKICRREVSTLPSPSLTLPILYTDDAD